MALGLVGVTGSRAEREAEELALRRRHDAVIAAAQAGPRVELCGCGGTIGAPGHDWEAIASAVRVHNASTTHVQWAIQQGLRLPGERPTATPTSGDLSPAAARASAPPLAGGSEEEA